MPGIRRSGALRRRRGGTCGSSSISFASSTMPWRKRWAPAWRTSWREGTTSSRRSSVMPDQLNYFSLATKTADEDVRQQALLRWFQTFRKRSRAERAKLFSVHIASATAPPAGKAATRKCASGYSNSCWKIPTAVLSQKPCSWNKGKREIRRQRFGAGHIRLLEGINRTAWSHPGRPKDRSGNRSGNFNPACLLSRSGPFIYPPGSR